MCYWCPRFEEGPSWKQAWCPFASRQRGWCKKKGRNGKGVTSLRLCSHRSLSLYSISLSKSLPWLDQSSPASLCSLHFSWVSHRPVRCVLEPHLERDTRSAYGHITCWYLLPSSFSYLVFSSLTRVQQQNDLQACNTRRPMCPNHSPPFSFFLSLSSCSLGQCLPTPWHRTWQLWRTTFATLSTWPPMDMWLRPWSSHTLPLGHMSPNAQECHLLPGNLLATLAALLCTTSKPQER